MRNILLIFTLLIVTMLACEKVLQVEFPPMEKKLVTNCLFRPDSLFKVFISNAFYPDDSVWVEDIAHRFPSHPYKYIENAKVEIYEDGKLAEELPHEANGMYRAKNLYPKFGKTYRLKAFVPGYPEITAESYMPLPVYYDTVLIDKEKDRYGQMAYLLINKFKDPPGENYYGIDLKRVNTNIRVEFICSDPVFDPDSKDELPYKRQDLFTDELFDGKTYSLSILLSRSEYRSGYSDSRFFEYRLVSLSKDYYLYFKTLFAQGYASGSFDEIPMVYGNINNGKGIFAGWCFAADTMNLPEPKEFFGD